MKIKKIKKELNVSLANKKLSLKTFFTDQVLFVAEVVVTVFTRAPGGSYGGFQVI